MRVASLIGGVAIALAFSAFTSAVLAEDNPVPSQGKAHPGAPVYESHCARCHDHPVDRIPSREFLAVLKTPEQVVAALTSGVMKPMAVDLKPRQIRSLASFITGKEPGATHDPDPKANRCVGATKPLVPGPKDWNGWGIDWRSARFHPESGLTAADVPLLKVKWVFALPGNVADGQPSVVDGTVFVGNRAGGVFALDAKTGCTRWFLTLDGGVHAAIPVGPAGKAMAAFVITENGYLHARDAVTGKKIWITRVEDHPTVRLTGTPVVYEGRIYVPLASLEEVTLYNPAYGCCTFRGGIAAVDAATGKVLWKSYVIAEEPKIIATNPATGVNLYGPAGGAIFSAPTIDPKRRLIYAGTGNSYTQKSDEGTNAVMAFDLDTGAKRWAVQALAQDDVCPKAARAEDCSHEGPDFDFAAPPVLHTMANGKDILVAVSKADEIFGLDPDAMGKVVWRTKIGKGSRLAGVWGLTIDSKNLYVGASDLRPEPGVEVGGINGLDLATGKRIWHTPAPAAECSWGMAQNALARANNALTCSQAQPGAVAAIPGVVFSGSVDGHIRAYSTADGQRLWDFDTGVTFKAVNAPSATGGSLNYGVQAVAGGMLFVNSGAAGVHQNGNALIAFSVDGK